MASYPTSIWDGTSLNRDPALGQRKTPNADDWQRCVAEVAATQTRINENAAGIDEDALDSVGTLPVVAGLTVVEKGDGAVHKTILTLDEVAVAITDGTTPATDAAWGTKLLYTLPTGRVLLFGSHQVYPVGGLEAVTGGGTGLSSTADLEIGVGSAARANGTNFALQTTEENICASADANLVAKLSDAIETTTSTAVAIFDGTTTPLGLHLNVVGLGDDDSGETADVLKVSGTITIVWTLLGDD